MSLVKILVSKRRSAVTMRVCTGFSQMMTICDEMIELPNIT